MESTNFISTLEPQAKDLVTGTHELIAELLRTLERRRVL
jgi:hypothetical protein